MASNQLVDLNDILSFEIASRSFSESEAIYL